jgi:hypothetical protein
VKHFAACADNRPRTGRSNETAMQPGWKGSDSTPTLRPSRRQVAAGSAEPRRSRKTTARSQQWRLLVLFTRRARGRRKFVAAIWP